MRKSLLIGAAALSMGYTAGAVAEMPAVTGFNAKVEGAYGQLDGEDNYGLGGSIAIPLIEQLGLQFDAGVGMTGAEENAMFGGGLSLFWRSSSIGSLGLSGVYVDVEDAAWVSRIQADGEIYLGDVTLGGAFGFHDSDWGQDAFVTGADLTFYPASNVALTGGMDYFGFDEEDLQFNLGAEIGLADILSIFANGKMGTESEESFGIGLRVAFGSSTSDLKRQHREFNTRGNAVSALVSQNDMLFGRASAAMAGAAGGAGACPIPDPLDPACAIPIF